MKLTVFAVCAGTCSSSSYSSVVPTGERPPSKMALPARNWGSLLQTKIQDKLAQGGGLKFHLLLSYLSGPSELQCHQVLPPSFWCLSYLPHGDEFTSRGSLQINFGPSELSSSLNCLIILLVCVALKFLLQCTSNSGDALGPYIRRDKKALLQTQSKQSTRSWWAYLKVLQRGLGHCGWRSSPLCPAVLLLKFPPSCNEFYDLNSGAKVPWSFKNIWVPTYSMSDHGV